MVTWSSLPNRSHTNAQRIVVTRQQHSLASLRCPAGPRHREARLAAAGAAGHHHAPVGVEGLEYLHLIRTDRFEPHSSESCTGFRVEDEGGVGAHGLDDRSEPLRTDFASPAQGQQAVERTHRIFEITGQQELCAVSIRGKVTDEFAHVREGHGVVDGQALE